MGSVHDRLAECEQRNGAHPEDVMSGMMFFFVLCFVLVPLIQLFLQMLKYVLPYKCNSVMISKVFNFFSNLKIARFAGGPCILSLFILRTLKYTEHFVGMMHLHEVEISNEL